MSEPVAYLNGQWLPLSQAALPLHDAGFVFGATVTDLCRTFHHRLYRLAEHLSRFEESCHLARVKLTVNREELTGLAEKLVASNARLIRPEEELALVVFATPGPLGHYAGQPG